MLCYIFKFFDLKIDLIDNNFLQKTNKTQNFLMPKNNHNI